MIGPSSGAGGMTNRDGIADGQSRAMKRKVLDELDIDSFCQEVCQNGRKRYLQELETPVELIPSGDLISDTTTLFPPLSDQEAMEDYPVARLEVLVVDGTTCTWATMSELEAHQQQSQHHQETIGLMDLTSCGSSLSSLSSTFSTSSSSTSPASSLSTSTLLSHRDRVSSQANPQCESSTYHQTMPNDQYWEPLSSLVAIPTGEALQNDRYEFISCSEHDSNQQLHQRPQQQHQPKQQEQQQQQFDDQENGNLSWLLDFKLDSLIEAADDRSTVVPKSRESTYGNKNKFNARSHGSTTATSDGKRIHGNLNENLSTVHQDTNQSISYSMHDNRNFSTSRCNGPKKPPFTYTELIEHALQERGELTVSAIYQWISEHFPYYKSNDDRWKNSVRHNLSINPHFRKGSKAPHGAGHLWAIANRSDFRPRQLNGIGIVNSAARQIAKNPSEGSLRTTVSGHIVPMDEIEAATASIAQSSSEDETEHIVNTVTLEHCAEQILNGVKREVEVQYLVPMMVSNSNDHDGTPANQEIMQTELDCPSKESDFLNPVSKEVVAEECGLISEGYLVTDLNPTTLGLNMVEPEIIAPDNLFGEDLNFQFYELASPSQLQSA